MTIDNMGINPRKSDIFFYEKRPFDRLNLWAKLAPKPAKNRGSQLPGAGQ
jgi:hypothetical protein